MLKQIVFFFILINLSACIPNLLPEESARSINAGERLLNESFTTSGTWSSYTTDLLSANVVDGVYRMFLADPNQYIWGSDGRTYDDILIEVDVTWLSDNPDSFTGVICRLDPDGRGYYVMISASGDFTIRYITQTIDDAIVRWQGNPKIPRSGSFQMRVACVEDFIALYIDGEYVDGGTDSRLLDGQIGLAIGLPRSVSAGDNVLVEFDNLRVWDANFP